MQNPLSVDSDASVMLYKPTDRKETSETKHGVCPSLEASLGAVPVRLYHEQLRNFVPLIPCQNQKVGKSSVRTFSLSKVHLVDLLRGEHHYQCHHRYMNGKTSGRKIADKI